MRTLKITMLRQGLIAFAGLVMLSLVQAQNPAPPATAPGAGDTVQNTGPMGRDNQKIEHIRIEDKGAVVDEVRYGGQTQSITVTPKAGVPAYEVRPNEPNRVAPQGRTETGANGNGPRVWNVLKF